MCRTSMVFILLFFLFFPSFLNHFTLPTRVLAVSYTCPLSTSNITGVMQWNDGWPFSFYGRQTHNNDAYQVVDVNAYYGSVVYAPTDGSVIDVYTDPTSDVSYGTTIAILGDDGFYYEMSHVINVIVNKNQRVLAGQKVGNLVSLENANTDGRLCDLTQNFTTQRCYKVHNHFTVYEGTYQHPVSGHTLSFLSSYCNLNRPLGDTNPEFPQLPTLNCAKITGNPNIERCFMQKTISLATGWNRIVWTDISGNTLGQLPDGCFLVREDKKSFVRNFSPVNLTLDDNKIYFIACRGLTHWSL